MARFITVQALPTVATQDEVIEAGRAMANAAQCGARWLRSWISGEEGRILSEWEAPEESLVRTALRRAGLFRVEALYEVGVIEPAWFDAQMLPS